MKWCWAVLSALLVLPAYSAHIVKDRVAETTTTTGTGSLTVAGALTGFRSFNSVCATNDTFPYSAWGVDGNGNATGEWETGLGTYSASNTITRTTVYGSSNSNALVNFSTGTKYISISPLASRTLQLDDDNAITMPAAAITPPAPAAGNLTSFARSRAGRMLPHIIGPSGLDTALQPALFGNNIAMWLPGNGTTVAINFGVGFTARNSGTGAAQAHPTLASTNDMTQMKRATFGTGTTATGASGIQTTTTVAWRGNAAGRGGFFFFSRFGIETLASDQRVFVGLSANNAAMAADANTWNNTIGIEKGTADAVWYLVERNGSTATRTSTGVTVTAGQVLDLMLFTPPNGSSVVARLIDAFTGTVYVDNVTLNTTLPVNTTFLYMQAHTQSVTGTTAKLLALNRLYLESDT